MTIVEGGFPVSICFCARLSEVAAEAGLDTAEAYRGRGYGSRVTAAWALAKREADEEALQRRLHAEAKKWIGSIGSGDRHRSVQGRERVRAKLMAKHRRLQREAPGSRRR